MTFAEFKKKWSRYQGKETSAYQGHFDDLCRLLGQPTPAEADPSGSDFFCYQKRVVKDAELFDLGESSDPGEPSERGFADVWKKGFFAWEYKGKKKSLDEAYKQLLRYRESLLNPPLLVVCDFDRYIIKTNFNGTVQEVHEFTNDQIDRRENLRALRALFTDPYYLKPIRTTAAVTEALAEKIGEVARSLQKRESVELADAKSRAQLNYAQRKNLRIARFLNRIVFCMFAEDTRLLPADLFTEILKTAVDDAAHFARTLENLFNVMAKGGEFGKYKVRHFNGHLFDDSSVFELNEPELRLLGEAAEADWQFIEPSIMGTLFERALEPEQRSQLGAHYTSEADIKTLVEPVLMQPFRREWVKIKRELGAAYTKGKGNAAQRERLAKFQTQLSGVTVFDPACGSGNFLYVSLQLLLGLEKEIIAFATQLGFACKTQVSVSQLMAIEINPYAFELAQVSVQIGFLQWRRDNGFDNDRTPVLQVLDGFENTDALLRITYRSEPKNLKEARSQEHEFDSPFQLKAYHERHWPKCHVIVSNPPFLGDKLMRGELGNEYVVELRRIFSERIPGQSDFCCYWFEKARALIAEGKCQRAGLLATQGIRGSANREVIKRIKQSGNIFFAVSDQDWVLDGATVHVSMVGFDNGGEAERWLDGKKTDDINANLSTATDTTKSCKLRVNDNLSFLGSCKGGDFDVSEAEATNILVSQMNARQKLNSDVVKPVKNSEDLLQRPADRWIIDTADLSLAATQNYKKPFAIVVARVRPHRDKNRDKWLRENWWRPQRMRPEMRHQIQPLARFLVTPTTSKHRLFIWLQHPILPDHQLIVFARDDDYFMGILQSHFHEVWSLAQGTQLRDKESGFRYTPTTCFETFPFPFPDDLPPRAPSPVKPLKRKQPQPDRTYAEHLAAKNYFYGKEDSPPYRIYEVPAEIRADVSAAAKELNEYRERWLNPPEWTVEKILEFPGSIDGPWARYVVNPDKNGIGTVHYPRLEPRDPECAAKLKERTLTKLYNERPAWLDFAHQKLDAAVAAAYGWPADLTDEQILERLLALNLARAEQEVTAAKSKQPIRFREKTADELL